MIFRLRRLALCCLLTVGPVFAAPAMLGTQRLYRTPYTILHGEGPGPVVLIQAGIHGDEVAGTHALDAMLKDIAIANGTVIVIPRLNRPAVARNRRYVHYDLNRAFGDPGRSKPYEFALARDLMAFARAEKIDYMVTLHDARALYDPAVPRSLGQTLCYGVLPMPILLDQWLPKLNDAVAAADRFHAMYFPISTSSTEVMTAALNLKGGFCVETWRELPMARRIAYQRAAVETFLATVGIAYRYGEPPVPAPRPAP